MVYFLIHDFIYGWDVAQFTQTDGQDHVYLMHSFKEAEEEMLDTPVDEQGLWKVVKGFLNPTTNVLTTLDGAKYNYLGTAEIH